MSWNACAGGSSEREQLQGGEQLVSRGVSLNACARGSRKREQQPLAGGWMGGGGLERGMRVRRGQQDGPEAVGWGSDGWGCPGGVCGGGAGKGGRNTGDAAAGCWHASAAGVELVRGVRGCFQRGLSNCTVYDGWERNMNLWACEYKCGCEGVESEWASACLQLVVVVPYIGSEC